ncbi:MAG TPA: metalloregulator ArsR/SmtB family transcription factor [Humibacter sp.]|nr:metalloregulator ArsR/SmtB family transcription factor [Humibacter sp.]
MAISVSGKYDVVASSKSADIGVVFAALADPTRRRIVETLHDHESTVGALADELELGAPTVSKHLTVLERAGLISRQRDAQRRVCRLEPTGFASLAEWSRRYERFWAGSLDSLDDYLAELETGEAAR